MIFEYLLKLLKKVRRLEKRISRLEEAVLGEPKIKLKQVVGPITRKG